MFVRNRVLSFALLTAPALLLLTAWSVAEERRPAEPRSPVSAHTYVGKIASIDTSGRMLVLEDIVPAGPRLKDGKGPGAPDRVRERKISFAVARNAMITLDGKAADLKDLKAGYAARVWASAPRAVGAKVPPPGAGSPDRPAGRDAKAVDRDRRAMMDATRIDAFSKGRVPPLKGRPERPRD
jgi:hypothetical protein